MLFDENLQGRLFRYFSQVLDGVGLSGDIRAAGNQIFDYPHSGFLGSLSDRFHWNYCQSNGLVPFRDNRNQDGPDSLQTTLNDSLRPDSLPVLTVPDKPPWQHSPRYARRVAWGVAEVLLGLTESADYRGIGRLDVPLPGYP